jgi:hypothetical protein
VITRDKLPDDAADWTNVIVSFERLPQDSPESCPVSEEEVFEYVRLESVDTDKAKRSRLRFIRTAQVVKSKYWLWEYMEKDRRRCYVVFRLNPNGSTVMSLSEPNGLSPNNTFCGLIQRDSLS